MVGLLDIASSAAGTDGLWTLATAAASGVGGFLWRQSGAKRYFDLRSSIDELSQIVDALPEPDGRKEKARHSEERLEIRQALSKHLKVLASAEALLRLIPASQLPRRALPNASELIVLLSGPLLFGGVAILKNGIPEIGMSEDMDQYFIVIGAVATFVLYAWLSKHASSSNVTMPGTTTTYYSILDDVENMRGKASKEIAKVLKKVFEEAYPEESRSLDRPRNRGDR